MGRRTPANEDRDVESGEPDRSSTTRPGTSDRPGPSGRKPDGLESVQGAVGNRAVQRAVRGRDEETGDAPADGPPSSLRPVGHSGEQGSSVGPGFGPDRSLDPDPTPGRAGTKRTTDTGTDSPGAPGGDAAGNTLSAGFGLPVGLRRAAESAGGVSLDDVSVEYDSRRPARYRASAYARGSTIYLGPDGRRHLPEETWHVVQQKQGRVEPTGTVAGEPLNADPALEREAKRKAATLPAGVRPATPGGGPAAGATRGDDPEAPIQRVTEGRHVPLNVQRGDSCWLYVFESLLRYEGADTTRLRRLMKSYPDVGEVDSIVADQSWMEELEAATGDQYTAHTRQAAGKLKYRSQAFEDNESGVTAYPFADTAGNPYFERDPDEPGSPFPSYFGDLKLAEMKLHNAWVELAEQAGKGATETQDMATTISVGQLRRIFTDTVGTDRPVEEFSTTGNASTGRNPRDDERVDVAYALEELERTVGLVRWLQARVATEHHVPQDVPEGLIHGDQRESHLGDLAPRSFLPIRVAAGVDQFAARVRKLDGPPVMAVIYRRPDARQYTAGAQSGGAQQTGEYDLEANLVDTGPPPAGATTSGRTHDQPRYTVDLRSTAPNGPEVRRTSQQSRLVGLATPIRTEDAPHVVVVSKVNVADGSIHYVDPNYGSDVEFVVSYTDFLDWGASGWNSQILSINSVR